MSSKELMHSAMDGRAVERVPVAPFFWGWDYSRTLVDMPVWEMVHGPVNMLLDRLSALDARHGCD